MTGYEAIARRVDAAATLRRRWDLRGGVSASMTVLELSGRAGLRRVVVRAHGEFDRARDPHLAEHEFALLRVLEHSGIGAPRALLLDTSAALLPSPYLVVEYIEGEAALAPPDPRATARGMATRLAAIHRLDVPAFDWLEDATDRRERLLARAGHDEFGARAALRRGGSRPAAQREVLLHGDFWPGNLLWRGDRLVGVIDWEDAARGDPLADVAIARLEILWLWGEAAMECFTECYVASTRVDSTGLPSWDLYAALRPAGRWEVWFPDADRRSAARGATRGFAARAIAAIAAT